MQNNPFIYGNPVYGKQFLGRRKVLRRIVGRILHEGQSTAVVGDPHIGKSSFLHFLATPESMTTLYGEKADMLQFSLVDIHMLGAQFTPAHFWELALTPIREQIEKSKTKEALAKQYQICYENSFGTNTLENLFRILKLENWRLVLLLDEFDVLLHHPILNSAEFYGGLRSVASRSRGALAVVLAMRSSVTALNAVTQEFNPTGSPFFNIFPEITLGPFSEKDVQELLTVSENLFTKDDKRIISRLAGKHPYLLQAAGAAMWEAHEDKLMEPEARARYVAKELYREHDLHFIDTWRVWSPEMRKAFTAIAMLQQESLLEGQSFLTSSFIEEFRYWGPELNHLEERGWIINRDDVEVGWTVASEIMLTWLADEIVKVIRHQKPFEQWLRDEQLDGVLTVREKEVFEKAVKSIAGMLKQGATTIIEAFAKGVGSSLAG